MIYLTLFLTFFKIGAFTFGGGYAMIPLIRDAVVNDYAWVTAEEFVDILAVVEMTPGPVAINSATFFGFQQGGFLGATVATFGVVLPSVIIITLIAKFMKNFSDNKYVVWAFKGIRPVVVGLLLSATVSVGMAGITDIYTVALLGLFMFLLQKFKLNPILIIGIAAVFGILIY
ncbi:MAG: chromate transporter [Tissierellia bacterium]|nr:chromate transporter [Tissierellia bacterium]